MRLLADKGLDRLETGILRVHHLVIAVPELKIVTAHDVNAYPDWAIMNE